MYLGKFDDTGPCPSVQLLTRARVEFNISWKEKVGVGCFPSNVSCHIDGIIQAMLDAICLVRSG